MEFCCREPSSAYPVNIPVFIRGHPPYSLQHPLQPGTHSGTSVVPSFAGGIGEEQNSSLIKRPSRGRLPSISHSGIGLDNDNKSTSIPGQEPSKSSSNYYKTFHLVRDSDFFRLKLLVDSTGNENEPIEQINTLYMRGIYLFFLHLIYYRIFFLAWQLDQRFIDILKKILPLQEQLHTLKYIFIFVYFYIYSILINSFCFVGLNEQTIYGLAEVCQSIKNLK